MPRVDTWIPMDDGVRLAASVFLPDGDGPWPALLEALPYRKDDLHAATLAGHARWAGEFGYASCRVDVRGTGSSEGLLHDEYTDRELRDLEAVVAWLAAEPWCTGSVGMFGTSWGGFNSLQVAMRRPPALRAICSIYASDDRYADDVHYFGGMLKQLDLVDWPLYMVASDALPPVPALAGPEWRERWRERVEDVEPWPFIWFAHQRFDDYWRHGSLATDYGAIDAATMLVTGWADGYTNVALRAMERMRCPRRLLAGPWGHVSPRSGRPGPNLDLAPQMARWFDRWLKDERNGVDEEPSITVFMRRPTPPAADLAVHRGEWRHERGWPVERLREVAQPLDRMTATPSKDTLAVRPDVGWTAWISCAGSPPWDQPLDQRPDEAHSLVHDGEPLDADLAILGHPRVRLRVASSAPIASVSVKLCDVHPDGTSQLVTRGLLNLTHRRSREHPEPMPVDSFEDVEVELEVTSWIFEPGHRVRLDVAGTDWPNAWPPPTPVTLTLDRSASSLVLPVLEGPSPEPAPRLEILPPPPREPDPTVVRVVSTDRARRETVAETAYGAPSPAGDGAPAMADRYEGLVGVSLDDPGRAWVEASARYEIAFPEATVAARARWRIDSDATTYRIALDLETTEDGEPRWSRRWERTFPRDLQ